MKLETAIQDTASYALSVSRLVLNLEDALKVVDFQKDIAKSARDETWEEVRRGQEEQAAKEQAGRAEQARNRREGERAGNAYAKARRPRPRSEGEWRDTREPFDEGRGRDLPTRPPRSPSQQQYGHEGLRPESFQQFDDTYRDEGYRSNRSSRGDSRS